MMEYKGYVAAVEFDDSIAAWPAWPGSTAGS